MQTSARGNRPFRFEAAWLLHKDFDTFLRNNWRTDTNFSEAAKKLEENLKKWNKETFGNIFHRKNILLTRLQGIQMARKQNESKRLMVLEKNLRAEYERILF